MKLIKDSAWNFASIIIPSLVAIPAFAWISRLVGIEIFGIFTLSFAIVGYASVFDLGLSRAVIREVAINRENPKVVASFVNTATSLILVLSGIACLALFVGSDVLVSIIKVSPDYTRDVANGMRLLALCLPLLLISNVWLAYFEGLSEFKALSYFKVFSSLATVVLPLLMVLYNPNFLMLMLGVFFARVLTFCASFFWIKKRVAVHFVIQKTYAHRLFNFGGWLTVSSIIGPVMVYFDRFILSAMIGTKQVAFYTAPSELIMRLLALPSAVSRTLFPRFSANHENQALTYRYSLIALGLSSFLIALPIFIFAEQILVLWLGDSFAGEPKWVLRILLVGFIFNAMAQIPFTKLQATGLSKTTALIHCSEVIPYLLVLYFLVNNYKVIGVAIAWSLRVTIDFIIMLFYDNKLNGISMIKNNEVEV